MSINPGLESPEGPREAPPVAEVWQRARDFSIVKGGLFFRLLRRANLAGEAATALRRRVVAVALLAWLPLLALTGLQGTTLGTRVAVPFLLDVDFQVRFLISLPLLILAEYVLQLYMRPIVENFLVRNLIPDKDLARFDAAMRSATRLCDSVLAEVLLLAVVYGLGVLVIWRHQVVLGTTATWYGAPSAGGFRLTLAGIWYGYLSQPIYQFLLVRWYFRLVVWARFLWQVARIPLRLVPTHPDRLGGMGFVANTGAALMVLGVAHGCLLAGNIANRIFYQGARLMDFKGVVVAWVVVLVVLFLGPLLVFSLQLVQVKRKGSREYGALAERYVRAFDTKWLRGGAATDEPLLGTGDIQSLADLGNSYEIVRSMRVVPITRDALLNLIGAILVPLVPLGLTMMPLEELLKQILSILV